MFYEIIYTVDGEKKTVYPQTKHKVESLIATIRENAPVYQLISCDACNNYEAYKAGDRLFTEFLLEQTGEVCAWDLTDKQVKDAVEQVLDAPFEYDKDLAYFVLCENRTLRAANEFYREVTA